MKKIIFFSIITLICARAQGQWQLTGNAGTNSGTNFIGTTDAKNFKIRTSNTIRMNITSTGKIGIGNFTPVFKLDVKSGSINTDSVYRIKGNTVLSVKGDYNLFTGVSSGFSNTLGGANVGSGYQALYSNTEGNFNTASGYNAMQYNTIGYNNTATGANALLSNTTASENTAIGNSALYAQSYSNGGVDWISANVAVGSFALLSNQPTSTSNGIQNTAVGHSALRNNTTGAYNTASGHRALYTNTTGFSNSATGVEALYSNTTGAYNTATGVQALYLNTKGDWNIAYGGWALRNNTTARQNTAIGVSALYSQSYNNGGTAWNSNNTAVGYEALYSNNPSTTTNGISNTAVGHSALRANTIGPENTATGYKALTINTSGGANTANGSYALESNTGSYNTAMGAYALRLNSTGNYNTAIGYEAFYHNSTGAYNTAIGMYALYNNTTGSYNTFLGYNSGANNVSGISNTCIGRVANTSLGNFVNATAIGDNAIVTATDKVRMGSSTVLVVEGQVAYSWPSDGRFKENVKDDVLGLDFILKLQPVSYNFNRLLFAKHVGEQIEGREEKLKTLSAIRSVGFIAQDVEKIIQQTDFTSFDAVHAPTNETDNYSMAYAEFVVPLVKAVQELNEELKSEVGSLKSEIENLKTEITNLKSGESAIENPKSEILFQNSPNPFNTQTEIKFQLPEKFNSAQLKITDANGKQVRNDILKSSSSIIIKAAEFAAGTYNYSLIIDGVNVDAKQMILSR